MYKRAEYFKAVDASAFVAAQKFEEMKDMRGLGVNVNLKRVESIIV